MNLDELLKINGAEIYDLKDEIGFKGVDSFERMQNYRYSNIGFDCDGTYGRIICKLIREIYRELWDWQDVSTKRNGLKRYAVSCFDNDILMGPETMNTFPTTQIIAGNSIDRNTLNIFANSVGRIGNMTLTLAGYNKYIAADYWDLKIDIQFINNENLSTKAKNKYINLFFQWDYVNITEQGYKLKEFWKEHAKRYKPIIEVIPDYIHKVDIYTLRRGIFMLGLLKISKNNRDDYLKIRDNILNTSSIIFGYEDAINKSKLLDLNINTYKILDLTYNSIISIK